MLSSYNSIVSLFCIVSRLISRQQQKRCAMVMADILDLRYGKKTQKSKTFEFGLKYPPPTYATILKFFYHNGCYFLGGCEVI